MRRFILLVTIAFLAVTVVPAGASAQPQGGPIILMGIDAEDGGPGGHGPISVYVDVVNSLNGDVTKSGEGILVVGGGKSPTDDVTEFWNEIATETGLPVTYVNTAAGIAAVDFTPFRILGVVSDENETSDGGLTQEEHDALTARQEDVAAFVNAGGGLLGFSSTFDDPSAGAGPYAYMGGVGGFSIRTDTDYSDITPTPEGEAVGITNDLDVGAWHNTFLSFPNFLSILATVAESGEAFGEAAALGGENVFLGCREFPDATGNIIVGTEGDDTIVGTKGDDVICGLGGNDTIRGLHGNDLIAGGTGNDAIRSGHGNDQAVGGAGNDSLRGQPGGDVLKGQAGNDKAFGGRGNDRINGGKGRDRCKGGSGRDTVRACER